LQGYFTEGVTPRCHTWRVTLPNFICRNRHGTYYFRFIIPVALRSHFSNKREYRCSLQTDSKKLAAKRAKIYRIRLDLLFEKPQTMSDIMKNGFISSFDLFGVKIEADFDGDEEKELRAIKQMKKDSIEQAIELGMDPALLIASPQSQSTPGTNIGANTDTPKISTISKIHLKDAIERMHLSKNTVDDYQSTHELFIFVLGEDKQIGNLTNNDLEFFYDNLTHIPTARKSNATYKDKSLLELKQMQIPASHRQGITTRNKHFSRVRALLDFGIKKYSQSHGFTYNPATSVTTERDTVRAKDKRKEFERADLEKMFSTTYFTDHNWVKKQQKRRDAEPYRFWMYPLALLTGARQAELLQLDRKDISSDENGIWYMNILEEIDGETGEKIKSTKNQNSIRKVPLSNILIDMGFIKFVQSGRSTQLFPELKSKKDGKDTAQKFLNAQLKRWGIHEKHVKTFHSLRHNFVTQAINNGIKARYIGGVTGHLDKKEFGGVAEIANTYLKGFTPLILKEEVIDKLSYGLDFSRIKW
jgi:integrase